MRGKRLALLLTASTQNLAYAQSPHEIDVSNYIGFFRTSISDSPEVQILSALGGQIGYTYNPLDNASLFSQYSFLSSGKTLLMHGLNCGYEYAFFGGHNKTVTIPKNTAIAATFPRRASVFSAVAFRMHNLEGIVVPSKSILRPTVPVKGNFVGIDFGLGYEQSFANRLRFLTRASLLMPRFIGQESQRGLLISLTAGVGATL